MLLLEVLLHDIHVTYMYSVYQGRCMAYFISYNILVDSSRLDCDGKIYHVKDNSVLNGYLSTGVIDR